MANVPVQRMSQLLAKTLRDDPADAEVLSHKLLVRAGYVRRTAAGIWSWLPLGKKVLANVERIVREEMDAVGAQEVLLPAILPREPYEATGRWEEYGPELFRLQDRRGGDYLLGPTHEEIFTLLVKDQASSYKDLPVILYQIQNKYRDEARPRAGILRGREFLMKDSYSFDTEDEGLARSYALHREAYQKIFARLGLDYRICAATAGAMGGSKSEEFLAPAEAGEDTFADCPNCDFAANTEAVSYELKPVDADSVPALEEIPTPDTPTIDTLVAASNQIAPRSEADGGAWTAADTLKNVVLAVTLPTGERQLVVIGVPGDRGVDLKRVEANIGSFLPMGGEIGLEAANDDDLKKQPLIVKGYLGPGLSLDEPLLGAESPTKLLYLVDPRVVRGTSWITGANQAGKHVYGLVAGRDFTWDGVIECTEVREGDPAPDGSGPLETARGIEMGHIFQLGRKYAEALELKVLDQNGKQVTVTMGSYGVGVTRAVAALAESNHDARGLVWPRAVAPADVHVVAVGKGEEIFATAERLAAELEAAGLDVLLDDRPKVSPGVKFGDAELVGVPTILAVGRGLADGVVEIKDRRSGEAENVAVDKAVDYVVNAVRTH